MGEHSGLGRSGRAAGVLQESDIFHVDVDWRELRGVLLEQVVEQVDVWCGGRVGHGAAGAQLFGDHALEGPGQRVLHVSDDDMLDGGVLANLRQSDRTNRLP